jgi:hypothetical protein
MQVTSYDDKVILSHARALYQRSGVIEAIYILVGVGLCSLGIALLAAAAHMAPAAIGGVAISAGMLGGMLGWAAGRDRALAMRCQAQVALAQVQIELNTRLAVFHLTVRPTSIPEEAPRRSGPARIAG